jgi:hypothetical protein
MNFPLFIFLIIIVLLAAVLCLPSIMAVSRQKQLFKPLRRDARRHFHSKTPRSGRVNRAASPCFVTGMARAECLCRDCQREAE